MKTRSIAEIEKYTQTLKQNLKDNPSIDKIKLQAVLERETVWSDQEHYLFMVALKTHGKNYTQMQDMIKTKTESQIREYFWRIQNIKNPTGD